MEELKQLYKTAKNAFVYDLVAAAALAETEEEEEFYMYVAGMNLRRFQKRLEGNHEG